MSASDMEVLKSYHKVEKVVQRQIRQVRGLNVYNLYDEEDLEQESWVGFMKARNGFNPSQGKFQTRVSFIVYYHLLYVLQMSHKKNAHVELREQVIDKGDATSSWDWSDFIDELSNDGYVLVMLLFDTPKALTKILEGTVGTNAPVLESLRRYLATIGWKTDRFLEAAANIRQALTT